MRPLEVWEGYQSAVVRRDWEAVGGFLAEDAVIEDRRPLGLGRLEGRAAILAYLRGMVELVADTRPVLTRVLEEGESSFAAEIAVRGEGFEIAYTMVGEIAEDRLSRGTFYELGDPSANAQPE